MADFPTNLLSRGESPSLYKFTYEDKAIKADTDGGYEFRRDRFTRAPRRMFETGFIGLTNDDFEILDAFYLEHTNTKPFVWYDYPQGLLRTVRFDLFESDYVGVGTTVLWNLKIKMSEL